MAEIKSIEMNDGRIELKLAMNKSEYKILKHHTTDLLVLPSGSDMLADHLTTGKLGNSNRIMLPKKVLARYNISQLDKKAASNIFILDGDAFLLAKIKESKLGVPKFKEE